jgi:hypothetical protein
MQSPKDALKKLIDQTQKTQTLNRPPEKPKSPQTYVPVTLPKTPKGGTGK